jgi:uncharacterized damage-inducible protein DinB
MNADTIRMLYDYNYWAHRMVWDCVTQLSEADFKRNTGYSWGSVHAQVVHTMGAEWIWFSRLQGTSPDSMLQTDDYPDYASIRARWDEIEAEVRAYVNGLTDEQIRGTFTYSTTSGREYTEPALDILLHIVNHGTDHRAQTLAMLHKLGAPTVEQDLIFYLREKAEHKEAGQRA